MRTILIVVAVVAAVFTASVGVVWYLLRQQQPEAIVERLRRGEGDKTEQLMKLQLARGEVVPVIARNVADTKGEAGFRGDLLELLFRRYQREPDRDVRPVLVAALKDPDAKVRQRAAYCFAAYGDEALQTALLGSLDDASAEVRRLAYATFLGGDNARSPMWTHELTAEQKAALVERCREKMKSEEDPELQFLARGIVGRQVESELDKAGEALQSGNLAAEQMIRHALELDPENKQAQVRLARFYLATGDKKRALETADRYGALLRVPRLQAAPTVDGDPTEPAWKGALKVPLAWQTTSRWANKRVAGKSEALVAHHGGRIYIAVLGYEDDLDQLSVKHTQRDSDVWEDDCVELFFDPQNREQGGYQFAINPANAVFDQYKGDIKLNTPCQTAAKVFKDRGYWAVEFSVAVSDLEGAKLTPDAVWGMNLARPRIGAAAEYPVFWPTFGGSQQYNKMPLAVFESI